MDRAYTTKEDLKWLLTEQIQNNSNKKEGEKNFDKEMEIIDVAHGK